MGGWPRRHLGQCKPRASPDSGRPPLLRARPTKRKPERGSRLPWACKSRTGKDGTRPGCPVPDGPSRHVQKPRRHGPPPPPHSASPRGRGLHGGFPPPRTGHSPTPSVTSPAGPAAAEPAAARPHPGVADANFREQKSCLQNDAGTSGCAGTPGSLAPSPGLKLRRGEGGSPQGAAVPAPAPGKRRLFRRGRAGSLPWLRSDKSHACTSGGTQRPKKPPGPTRNQAGGPKGNQPHKY